MTPLNPLTEACAHYTRRQFFGRSVLGLGTAALASLLGRDALAATGRPLTIALATGRERWFPVIALGTLLVLMLALPGAAPDSLLALGALATVVNLARRNGRFFQAVGWTILLLAAGLALSLALLSAFALPAGPALLIQPAQLQGAVALLVLVLGALFIG